MLKIFQSPSSKRFLCKFAAVLISAGVVVSCSKKDSSTSSSSSTKSDEKGSTFGKDKNGRPVFTSKMGMNVGDPASNSPELSASFSHPHIHNTGGDTVFQAVVPTSLNITGNNNFNKTLNVLGTAGNYYVQMVSFPLEVPLSMTLSGTRGGAAVSPMETTVTFTNNEGSLSPSSLVFAETRNIRQKGIRLIMQNPTGTGQERKFPFILRTDQPAVDYKIEGDNDSIGLFAEAGDNLTPLNGISGSRKLTLNYSIKKVGDTKQTFTILRKPKPGKTKRLSYKKMFIVRNSGQQAGLVIHKAWDVGIDQDVDGIIVNITNGKNTIDRSELQVRLTANILDDITDTQEENLRYEWSSPDKSLNFEGVDNDSEVMIYEKRPKGLISLKVTDNSTGAWTLVNYDVNESEDNEVNLEDFWGSLSDNWKRMLWKNIGRDISNEDEYLTDNITRDLAAKIQDMLNLTTIQWANADGYPGGNPAWRIKTLDPLKYFKGKNLNTLSLWGNDISDLTPLDNVSSTLTYLNLRTNNITNVSGLSSMKNLTVLLICENQIDNVTAFGSLGNLNRLWLDNTPVRSVHPELNSLSNLRRLLLYTVPNIDQAEVDRLKTELPQVDISYY